MKPLIVIFFAVLSSLSLLGQSAISAGAGESTNSQQLVVNWAIGELITGEFQQDLDNQNLRSDCDDCVPVVPTNKVDDLNEQTTVNQANISVFPNPAKEKISIQFSGFKTPLLTFRILTAAGQEIYQQRAAGTDQSFSFNVSHLKSGTYLLQATDKTKQTVTKKLVIF